MNLKQIPIWGTLGAWALCGSLTTLPEAGAIPSEEEPQPQQDGAETLTRGPIHEAFAETISYNPIAGIIVKKEPPAPIEEVPPDQQLVGSNVAWIPGYWGWDDEGSDFIWISGIWRNLPPGRQWVPGYWNPVEAGSQWVSGYWSDAQTEEVSYLPEPPASLENGPSVEASSEGQVWAPGSWVYQEDRYAWSPGYWQSAQSDWTWMPAHYAWTPHGYVFVPGYWDYDVPRRGVLFAPVRFAPDYYSRPGFVYSPVTVISLAVFAEHLFLRPNYCHYYYGDYYAPRYRDNGYFAPYAYYSSRRGFDPIFAKEVWQNRKDRNWLKQRETDFMFRRDNENARPPRNWAALQALARNPDAKDARNMAFVKPFSQYAKDVKGPQRFKPLAAPDKQKFIAQKQEMVKFAMDRRKLEAAGKGGAGADAPKRTTVEKTKFERSPIFGRAADKLAKGEAPPKLPPMRKIDPKAIPGGAPDGRGPDRKGDETTMDERGGKPGIVPKTVPPNEPKEGRGIRPKGNDPAEPTVPKGEPTPRRKVIPNETPQGNPDRTPRVDPDKAPKLEPKKVIPREEPEKKQVEPRKVVPQDTPRREVPQPERKVLPREEPKVMPKPEPKVIPRPEPKVVPTPQPRVQPQPQPKQVAPKGPAVNPGGGAARRGNDKDKGNDKND